MPGSEHRFTHESHTQSHLPTALHEAPFWPLSTERLTLRPAAAADARATWAYRKLPEVSRWVTSAWDDFAAYHDSFRDPEYLRERLVVEFAGVVVGEVVIRRQDAWSQRESMTAAQGAEAELGWSLDPAYSGRGFASEAVAAALRLGFEQLRLHRVHARCFSANGPSWRLMERLGMRREVHIVAGVRHRDGSWLDGYGYALLKDEWLAQQG